MTASDLLAELGRFVSVPLAFDRRGLCVLVCDDGLEVEIANLDTIQAVLLSASLADGPLTNPAATHAFALAYAHDLQRTRGAAISVDPVGGGVQLQSMRRAEDLTHQQFQRLVGDFIAAARQARADFAEAGRTPAHPAPDTAQPAPGDFIIRL